MTGQLRVIPDFTQIAPPHDGNHAEDGLAAGADVTWSTPEGIDLHALSTEADIANLDFSVRSGPIPDDVCEPAVDDSPICGILDR